jgi:hypothetical protein
VVQANSCTADKIKTDKNDNRTILQQLIWWINFGSACVNLEWAKQMVQSTGMESEKMQDPMELTRFFGQFDDIFQQLAIEYVIECQKFHRQSSCCNA